MSVAVRVNRNCVGEYEEEGQICQKKKKLHCDNYRDYGKKDKNNRIALGLESRHLLPLCT